MLQRQNVFLFRKKCNFARIFELAAMRRKFGGQRYDTTWQLIGVELGLTFMFAYSVR